MKYGNDAGRCLYVEATKAEELFSEMNEKGLSKRNMIVTDIVCN